MPLNRALVPGDVILNLDESAEMLGITVDELKDRIAKDIDPSPHFLRWEVAEAKEKVKAVK